MINTDSEWLSVALKSSPIPGPVVSVIMFGSRAMRPDRVRTDSDVDLLCVVEADLKFPQSVATKCQDVFLDISYTTDRLARYGLTKPDRNNANYVLNALTEGVLLYDPSNIGTELMFLARNVRDAGPPPMTPSQLRELRLRAGAALGRMDSLFSQARTTAADEGLLMFRCHNQFHLLFYAYCRTRQLWASSIANTFEWSKENNQELYQLASAFLEALTLEGKKDALYQLYRAIC
jgi:predicted nucleotidyltransferase